MAIQEKPKGLLSSAEPVFTLVLAASFLVHAAGVLAVTQIEAIEPVRTHADLARYRVAKPAFLPLPKAPRATTTMTTASEAPAKRRGATKGARDKAAVADVISQMRGIGLGDITRGDRSVISDVRDALEGMGDRGVVRELTHKECATCSGRPTVDVEELLAQTEPVRRLKEKRRAQLPEIDLGPPPEGAPRFDRRALQAALKRRASAVQGCYERLIKRDSDRAGKLVVEIALSKSGRAEDVDYVEDTVGSQELQGCVTRVLKRTRFPAPPEPVTATGRFVFSPAGS